MAFPPYLKDKREADAHFSELVPELAKQSLGKMASEACWGLELGGGGVCFDARTLSATADKNQHGKICPFLPLSRFGLHRNAKRKSSTMVSMQ